MTSPFFLSSIRVGAVSGSQYPIIEGAELLSFNTNATSHLVVMPASVSAGELLLVMWCSDGGTPTVAATGFTPVYDVAYSTNLRLSILAKVAVGGEGGTSVDFVTSAAERAGSIAYRISGWGGTIATHIAASATPVNGTLASVDCPSLTSGFGAVPTLWFSVCGTSGIGDGSAYPSGYAFAPASAYWSGNQGSTANAMVFSAHLSTTAASENPGTFEFTAALPVSAITVAVRGIV